MKNEGIGDFLKNEHNRFVYTKCSLAQIRPEKGSWWQWYASAFTGLLLSMILTISPNTVINVKDSVDLLNNIFLAFIAMEMGAYALFQALLSDKLIWELYNREKMLDDSNISFLGVILLFWAGVMLNILLLIVLNVIPKDFVLTKKEIIDNTICCIALFLYYALSFRVLFEVRNFAINIFKVFMARSKISVLETMKNEMDKDELN